MEDCRKVSLSFDDHTPEGGETVLNVRERVLDFLHNRVFVEFDDQLQEELKSTIKILLVSHGATIRELVKYFHSFGHESWSDLSDVNPSKTIAPNTSISEFKIYFEEEEEEELYLESSKLQNRRQIKTVELIRLYDVSHMDEDMRDHALSHPKSQKNVV